MAERLKAHGLLGEMAAEFAGTMILILFGVGVVAQVVATGVGEIQSIHWAWGLGVVFGVYVAGRISGAHLNPAVTIALAAFKGFPWRKVGPYALAQFLGAFFAALLVRWNYTEALAKADPGHTIKTQGVFSTLPANGNPNLPDYHQDVRGLAVAFHLDGSRPVISAQSLPLFSVRSPDEFQALISALAPGPAQLLRLPAFLLRHPHAALSLPTNNKALKAPLSYATLPYYAIHAYKWIAADGSSRFVRYHWMPEAGDHRLSGKDAKAGGRDYLKNEIAERLAAGPVRFTLRVQVAEDGDVTRDPSSRWPASRRVFDGGTLELTEPIAEEGVLVFDPTAVTDGIELSDDVVLQFRAGAYTESVNRRLA